MDDLKMPKPEQAGLSYCRTVYASLVDWYKIADSKGQLLLTLNGIFISVLGGVVLVKPRDLLAPRLELGWVTWSLMLASAVAIMISVISAIRCLYSQLGNFRLQTYTKLFIDSEGPRRYRPAVTFWFGTISHLEHDIGLHMFRSADDTFEVEALSEEILLLAPNVLKKHRWVNRGWLAAGVAMIFLLASAVSIVVEAY